MASHLGELALGSASSRSKSAILRGPGPKITTERSRACVFPRHERRRARFSVYTTRKAKARLCCVRTELSRSERHKSCAKSSLHLHKTMHGPSLSIRVGCITAGSEAVRVCWPRQRGQRLLDFRNILRTHKPSCTARLLVQIVEVGLHLRNEQTVARYIHPLHLDTETGPHAKHRSCGPSLRPSLPPKRHGEHTAC